MFDVITIGGATQDIFIQSDFGKIISTREIDNTQELLSFEYGAKLEIDKLAFDIGGGAVNTAVNFSNLGFNTATIVKIGNDLNAEAILQRIEERRVDKSLLIQCKELKTGFSVILTSFEGERTVLTHRGANSTININEIDFDAIKQAKWIYISSLSGKSNLVLDQIACFAKKHNVNMGFNPGTTQLKGGLENLKKVLSSVNVLILNKTEAEMVTGIKKERSRLNEKKCNVCGKCVESCPQKIYAIEEGKIVSDINEDRCIKGCQKCSEECPQNAIELEPWAVNAIEKLKKLKSMGPKVVVITDGSNGAQSFDGKNFYYAPIYPAKVTSTLGAGDAFASTFVGTLMDEWNIEKALKLASINSASIVQTFGAQQGLKTMEELEKTAEASPDYKTVTKDKSTFED